MSLFKLTFAGIIKKSEIRQAGAQQMAELSICKKNRGKQGEEDSFTWARINVWQPPEWMAAKLAVGYFIAGVGAFELRSYEKDGQKRQSAEVNCQSFDVEVANAGDDQGQAAPIRQRNDAPKARAVPARAPLEDAPPF